MSPHASGSDSTVSQTPTVHSPSTPAEPTSQPSQLLASLSPRFSFLPSLQGCSRWSSSKAAGSPATEAYISHPPTPSCQDSSFTGVYIAGTRTTENAAGSHFQHPILFDRHALGQVPWLIHIRTPQ